MHVETGRAPGALSEAGRGRSGEPLSLTQLDKAAATSRLRGPTGAKCASCSVDWAPLVDTVLGMPAGGEADRSLLTVATEGQRSIQFRAVAVRAPEPPGVSAAAMESDRLRESGRPAALDGGSGKQGDNRRNTSTCTGVALGGKSLAWPGVAAGTFARGVIERCVEASDCTDLGVAMSKTWDTGVAVGVATGGIALTDT